MTHNNDSKSRIVVKHWNFYLGYLPAREVGGIWRWRFRAPANIEHQEVIMGLKDFRIIQYPSTHLLRPHLVHGQEPRIPQLSCGHWSIVRLSPSRLGYSRRHSRSADVPACRTTKLVFSSSTGLLQKMIPTNNPCWALPLLQVHVHAPGLCRTALAIQYINQYGIVKNRTRST